jgi:hypothetical protein
MGGWRAFLVFDGTTLLQPVFQAQPFGPNESVMGLENPQFHSERLRNSR